MTDWLLRTGARIHNAAWDEKTDSECWEQRLVGNVLIQLGLVALRVELWLNQRGLGR